MNTDHVHVNRESYKPTAPSCSHAGMQIVYRCTLRQQSDVLPDNLWCSVACKFPHPIDFKGPFSIESIRWLKCECNLHL